MLRLTDHPWRTFEDIVRRYRPKRLDVLTGYVSAGTTEALKGLRVRARIIFGLDSASSALSGAQIDELKQLVTRHEMRWRSGLHAKMYLFDDAVIAVGSANLTRSACEDLDEILVVSDDASLIARARIQFERRWKNATTLRPSLLTPLPPRSAAGRNGIGAGIGVAHRGRRSGFGRNRFRSEDSGGASSRLPLTPGLTHRVVRLCAFWPMWADRLERDRRVLWSTSPKVHVGQIQIFCITKTGEGSREHESDPRLDAVHSLWRVTSPPRKTRGRWSLQAGFERVLVLRSPVPKTELIAKGLLKSDGWPKRSWGKTYAGTELRRLADVLARRNPKQARTVYRVLLGPESVERAEDLWERVRDYAVWCMAGGREIRTITDGVSNTITDVKPGSIGRRSVQGRTNASRVTRGEVLKLWQELKGGRKAHVLYFTRAIAAAAAPELTSAGEGSGA